MNPKRILVTLAIAGCFFAFSSPAQTPEKSRTIPSVAVKTIKGESTNTSTITNNGKPIIVSFWATWCKPCIEELNNIADVYADWQKETGVKLVAVSIDDARTAARVAPFVSGRSWPYEFLLDSNSDFKRALNVNNPPHTFLINGKGEIVWEHVGYIDGNEDELYEHLKKVIAAQ